MVSLEGGGREKRQNRAADHGRRVSHDGPPSPSRREYSTARSSVMRSPRSMSGRRQRPRAGSVRCRFAKLALRPRWAAGFAAYSFASMKRLAIASCIPHGALLVILLFALFVDHPWPGAVSACGWRDVASSPERHSRAAKRKSALTSHLSNPIALGGHGRHLEDGVIPPERIENPTQSPRQCRDRHAASPARGELLDPSM